MAAAAITHMEDNATEAFGFIGVDEHTLKGCVIQEATDLGVLLVMLDTSMVPDDFVLYSMSLDKGRRCRVVIRTDETIGAWLDGASD
ncbi:PilZ domain-containing protein [Methylobacterium sp. J-090]|uniref:PilZ domain-containing protein n=1 Tax=Methylobacterium sp. J-090 TaxID=2836666 RepID=UPI001FB9FC92|nr:PilZ domain-containing protein [Methylobacterium sp. J-090]MCJ2081847.1 PilZ domain-containing protein [Methylobacterium sp. J-090]